MASNSSLQPQPWTLLRQFVRPRPPVERCELCGLALAAEHPHLWELATRQLRCCCPACSILFSHQQDGRFRRVSARVERLADLQGSDAAWEELRLPINLAFFVRSTTAGRVLAYYPGPAGATESLLPLAAWARLAEANPVLASFEPEVEALLFSRLGEAPECYRVSIDECYKLVGLIRTHWRGLSGGTLVWGEIRRFFADLENRAQPTGGVAHAGSEL